MVREDIVNGRAPGDFIKPHPRSSDLVRRHARLFEARFGVPYPVNHAREIGIMARLLASLSAEKLEDLQNRFFDLPDTAWAVKEGGLSVAVFASQVPRLIVRARHQREIPCIDDMDFPEYCRWRRGKSPDELQPAAREALLKDWVVMTDGSVGRDDQ